MPTVLGFRPKLMILMIKISISYATDRGRRAGPPDGLRGRFRYRPECPSSPQRSARRHDGGLLDGRFASLGHTAGRFADGQPNNHSRYDAGYPDDEECDPSAEELLHPAARQKTGEDAERYAQRAIGMPRT